MQPQPPVRQSQVVWGVSIAVLVIDLTLLAGIAVGTIRARASFSKIFDDFEAELPLLTQLLMSVPGWLIILGAVLAAAIVGLKELAIRNAAVNLLLNLAVLVGLLGLAALLAVALFLPLVSLVQRLS